MLRFKLYTVFLFSIIFLASCGSRKSEPSFIATMELPEPIPGVCNPDMVVVILPLPNANQKEAKAPVTEEEMQIQLNKILAEDLKDLTLEADGMFRLIVNCRGKLVDVAVDNEELPEPMSSKVKAYFMGLGKWSAGRYGKKAVDTVTLISFKIEEGVLSFD
jgi:hypothetical protein